MNRRLAVLAACLLATSAIAQTPRPAQDAPVVPNNPDYTALQEGKPVDSRQSSGTSNRRRRPAK